MDSSRDINSNLLPMISDDEREIVEQIENCNSEVSEKQKELCIAHLRFLSTFYVNIIEVSESEKIYESWEIQQNKRYQMNCSRLLYKNDVSDVGSYVEWMAAKAKIKQLYECWLRELLGMIVVRDVRAICMHQMMAADCYWFLAKVNRPEFHEGVSNLEMAARCLEKILSLMCERLPTRNAFYVYLLKKYALIVQDYADFIGVIHSSHGSIDSLSQRVRALSMNSVRTTVTTAPVQEFCAEPTERDFSKCRHSIICLKMHTVRVRNSLHMNPLGEGTVKEENVEKERREIQTAMHDMQQIEDIVEQFV